MSLDPGLAERLATAVDAGFDEQIEFTRTLVRFGSTRGAEHAIQDLVHKSLRNRNYAVDRFDMDHAALGRHEGAGRIAEGHSTAPIVIGIHRPRNDTGRSLILQAHVDVVPTGPADMWRHPPFEPAIEDGWMYGRGAADMKAGHAANIFALDALRRAGFQPAGTVYVESVVEEESTGNGALMTHLRGYRADAALIPEPQDEKLVRANVGVLWFEIEVRGAPAHVRAMATGTNAIDAAWRIVADLRGLEAEWNAGKGDHAHFADEPHPINLNLGKIEGGDWASSVPSRCRVSCRIPLYPGTRAEHAAREVEKRIMRFAGTDPILAANPPRVSFNGFFSEGYVLEPGSDAEATLSAAHHAAAGEKLATMITGAYLDARVHALYDRIPALCYGPSSRNIHGIDEAVNIESVRRITKAITLFVADWCGLEPIAAE